MSYEIVGETIKSATSIKLGEIFKVATNEIDAKGNVIYKYPKRYKENISKPTYPSFWIIQVNQAITPAGVSSQRVTGTKLNRIQLDYIINIQYRVAENTETVTNLRQQLDEVGLKLNAEFNELNLELPTKVKNKSYEIIDGVGQFMFNITVFATTEEQVLNPMETLDTNIILNKED